MERQNYYQVLGIGRHASLQEIKTAFRRLAKDCHPDRSGGGDVRRFHLLTEAYRTLSEPRTRAVYDAGLPIQAWPDSPRTEPSPLGDMDGMPWEDDLWDILSSAQGYAPDDLPPDAELSISQQQAKVGGHLSLKLPMSKACPACGGTGRGTLGLCPQCRGRRVYNVMYELEMDLEPNTKDGDLITLPAEEGEQSLRILIRVDDSPD